MYSDSQFIVVISQILFYAQIKMIIVVDLDSIYSLGNNREDYGQIGSQEEFPYVASFMTVTSDYLVEFTHELKTLIMIITTFTF